MHGHARVGFEMAAQHLRFFRMQFAQRDAVLLAQRVRQQPRRAGVAVRAVLLAAGLHGGQIAADRGLLGGFCDQAGNAVLRLAGFLRGFAIQAVHAAPGVGIQCEAGRRFGGQCIAQGQQDHVFEHIGVVAGVKSVTVIHDAILRQT